MFIVWLLLIWCSVRFMQSAAIVIAHAAPANDLWPGADPAVREPKPPDTWFSRSRLRARAPFRQQADTQQPDVVPFFALPGTRTLL